MALIEIQGLSVFYGSPARPILDKIDLNIEKGEFVCILGQTGCGKSTLLRMLLGSEHSPHGRILIAGSEHKQPDRTRGYVPQKYSLFPDKTVLDNITFGAEVSEFGLFGFLRPAYYRRRREFRARAFEYIERIGLLRTDAGKYPDQLSGGMQQRVAIAQALMTDPSILLMDEAFSALDPGTRKGMQKLIRDLWQATGITVLFVTHNTHEALFLSSRVIVLAKDAPEKGSRIRLDLKVPQPCLADDMAGLAHRLEEVSSGPEAHDEVAEACPDNQTVPLAMS
jgi:NitT/TauT family transport system ATP-binding protein